VVGRGNTIDYYTKPDGTKVINSGFNLMVGRYNESRSISGMALGSYLIVDGGYGS
jgi:hypothetical protein